MPRFSVITPSYNQAQFIGATIASVLSQEVDLDYWIIDGGSTDGTVSILQAQTDPRLHWISERDSGQADAINKGLARASGDLLTFINSDDTLLPGALKFAADYFDTHPDADLIYGDVQFIDADGAALHDFRSAPFDLRRAMLSGQPFTQPGMVWRSALTRSVGPFNSGLHYQFDRDFLVRAAVAGARLDYAPGTRATYRLHDASKTVSQQDKFMEDWRRVTRDLLARPDLPDAIRAVQPEVDAYFNWHDGKRALLSGDHAAARPRLWRTLRGDRLTRRILAAALLLESYTGLRTAPLLARMYTRITGTSIELLSEPDWQKKA